LRRTFEGVAPSVRAGALIRDRSAESAEPFSNVRRDGKLRMAEPLSRAFAAEAPAPSF